jgi:trans-2,3-dihydro-3-hydroxyanthranilate isomerase
MKRLHYHLIDVFTDRAFGGNPLAVFTEGAGIPDPLMQSIAKELNLSETTFVLAPDDPKHDCRVRIFTPGSELPMAGHPTVGTAFVLAREGILKKSDVIFEEAVGPVPVSIELENGAPGFIEMRQPLPKFGLRFGDVDAIAEMLSLEPRAIRETKLPVEIVSCGVPYLLVPLDGLESIRRIRFRTDVWERVVRGQAPAPDVFVFTTAAEFPGSDIHSRMFAPAHGISEDPATGSAHGPLGCYLVRHGVLPSEDELRFVSEQGVEMGRPSFLRIRIAHDRGEISAVRVGGTCHYMGGGYFDIAELS